jgi:hypothetical protein
MFGISPFAAAPFASLSDVTIVVALTGVQSAGNVGTVAYEEQWPQTGDVAVGAVGTVGVTLTIELTGVVASGLLGDIVRGDTSFELSGVAASGAVYTPTSGQPLTGVQAGGAVGNVIAVYWKLIDDSQTANWQNITDTQTTTWTLEQSELATTWQLIDTTP